MRLIGHRPNVEEADAYRRVPQMVACVVRYRKWVVALLRHENSVCTYLHITIFFPAEARLRERPFNAVID